LPPQRFTIEPGDVVHETIDGEVILIALQSGCYYSLDGAGAEIWQALAAGRSLEETVEELERRYQADPGQIEAAVSVLVAELVAERLLHRAEPRVPSGNGGPPLPSAGNGARTAFDPPILAKYTDMQDFLLVDPVHEVDDAGWPHPAPAP
jgi:hypothetical protein